MPLGLTTTKSYPADTAIAHWRGLVIDDAAQFDLYLRGPVRARVTDAEFESAVEADLAALATTQMAKDTLAQLLDASIEPLDWEIGEAMAECLLSDEHGACWPWNENRDRKTPRASLPGADLVGFVGDGADTVFLFGEVKTSSHASNPPGVMNGRSGMIHQLDSLSAAKDVQFTLLKWLSARCRGTELQQKYEIASRRFLHSKGTDFALVGVLLRDTPAHADDLRTRGEALSKGAALPRIRLDAWYAPRPISEWVGLTMAEA